MLAVRREGSEPYGVIAPGSPELMLVAGMGRKLPLVSRWRRRIVNYEMLKISTAHLYDDRSSSRKYIATKRGTLLRDQLSCGRGMIMRNSRLDGPCLNRALRKIRLCSVPSQPLACKAPSSTDWNAKRIIRLHLIVTHHWPDSHCSWGRFAFSPARAGIQVHR